MSAAVYRVGTLGRRLETAGAWLLGGFAVLQFQLIERRVHYR